MNSNSPQNPRQHLFNQLLEKAIENPHIAVGLRCVLHAQTDYLGSGCTQLTQSYIANACDRSRTVGRIVREKICELTEWKFNRGGWAYISPEEKKQIRFVVERLEEHGMIPELPDWLQPTGEPIYIARLPKGTLMRCPNPDHVDRHPSFGFEFDHTTGRGGGRCFACGQRYALRADPDSSGILAFPSRENKVLTELSGVYAKIGGTVRGKAPVDDRDDRDDCGDCDDCGDREQEPCEPVVRPLRLPSLTHVESGSRPPRFFVRRLVHENTPIGPIVSGGGLRRVGYSPVAAELWASRGRRGEVIQGPIPNATTVDRLISVGRGFAKDWRSWFRKTPVGPREVHQPRTWGSSRTSRILFDIDGHRPQDDGKDPDSPCADALSRLRRVFPGAAQVSLVRTSPTGSHVLVQLDREVLWKELLGHREWLREAGRRILDALGWGGRIDEQVWHSTAMTRCAGWRTLKDGTGWYVRWHTSGSLTPEQRNRVYSRQTGPRPMVFEHGDPHPTDKGLWWDKIRRCWVGLALSRNGKRGSPPQREDYYREDGAQHPQDPALSWCAERQIWRPATRRERMFRA